MKQKIFLHNSIIYLSVNGIILENKKLAKKERINVK
jgi:hypothetical protein